MKFFSASLFWFWCVFLLRLKIFLALIWNQKNGLKTWCLSQQSFENQRQQKSFQLFGAIHMLHLPSNQCVLRKAQCVGHGTLNKELLGMSPTVCKLKPFSPEEAWQCLGSRSLCFAGDSQIWDLAVAFGFFLQGCRKFDKDMDLKFDKKGHNFNGWMWRSHWWSWLLEWNKCANCKLWWWNCVSCVSKFHTWRWQSLFQNCCMAFDFSSVWTRKERVESPMWATHWMIDWLARKEFGKATSFLSILVCMIMMVLLLKLRRMWHCLAHSTTWQTASFIVFWIASRMTTMLLKF